MKAFPFPVFLGIMFLLAGVEPVVAQQYNFTTFAGAPSGRGSADGTTSAARFFFPSGVAVDGAGNVYVADTWNHTIRKTAADGVVSTLAGSADERGTADGIGSVARFNAPGGVAVDKTGNVYVADFYNSTIRKITPANVVTTLAGLAGKPGKTDGTGSAARFNQPSGVALDKASNLYVTDSDNATIRMITPDGVVSTVAGAAGSYGSADGPARSARFRWPTGIAADGLGNLYVADAYNATIRKITPDGVVSTLAGLAGNGGSADGTGSDARFSEPRGLAVDTAGNVYVADPLVPAIRRISPGGVVTTMAGLFGHWGSADGIASGARFCAPMGLALDNAGILYVADSGDSTIRKISTTGAVSTLAGRPGGYPGDDEGIGSAARFALPTGVAVDKVGNVYVADTLNNAIRKITPTALVSTFVDFDGDGPNAERTDNWSAEGPRGVAVDSLGNVYVADTGKSIILKITPEGFISTLAGLAGEGGSADGTGAAARFGMPRGLAVGTDDIIYVADTYNHTIRKITPTGRVSTLAGLAGHFGLTDGTGPIARFSWPIGVATDQEGNVYVADTENHSVRRITPAGVVSTVAGSGTSGYADGIGSTAEFGFPTGVAVDGAGNIYVAEGSSLAFEQGYGHATIRRITPDGAVTTLAGQPHNHGSDDGTGSTALFTNPTGVALDSAGNIYVTDTAHSTVRLGKVVPVTPPLMSPQPRSHPTTGHFQFEVRASTNQLVLIQSASVLATTNWNTIQTVTLWNGRSTIIDPHASETPLRVYRAISPIP